MVRVGSVDVGPHSGRFAMLRRSVVRAREAAEAIDRDLKAIAARAREADARRAELEKQYKLQVCPLY